MRNCSLDITIETKTATMFCKCCLAGETTPPNVSYDFIMKTYESFKQTHNREH